MLFGQSTVRQTVMTLSIIGFVHSYDMFCFSDMKVTTETASFQNLKIWLYSLMQTTWMKSRARVEFVEFYTGDGPGFSFKWFALNCKSKYDSWKNGAKQSWLY